MTAGLLDSACLASPLLNVGALPDVAGRQSCDGLWEAVELGELVNPLSAHGEKLGDLRKAHEVIWHTSNARA